MFRWVYISGALLCCVAAKSVAQSPARLADAVFARAQGLVSDGNGAAGRALVDSVIKVTSPTSSIYPQALFWRASLAASAADAESDYRHIVVDYPLAPQAEDALLRLAQLELARGDREGALAHLQRIPRDYPRSKSLARAEYWTARVLFEKNDVANACAANASALAKTTESDVELRNQIQYQGQRCAAYAASSTAAAALDAAAAAATVAKNPPAAESTSVPAAPAPESTTSIVADVKPIAADSEARAPVSSTKEPESQVKPPAEARDTRPSIVEPSAKVSAAKPATPKTASSSSTRTYSVQVAAYSKRPAAEKLASTLSKRGYEARIDGDVAPFRVRIGRYATARDAESALVKIKAEHMDGFVVRAPEK